MAERPGQTAVADAGEPPSPCSLTHLRNDDVDEQAASLRRWDQVYEQLTPGRFIGTLHEVCFGRVQIFRETTSQSVHEAGGACRTWRSLGRTSAFAKRIDGDTHPPSEETASLEESLGRGKRCAAQRSLRRVSDSGQHVSGGFRRRIRTPKDALGLTGEHLRHRFVHRETQRCPPF